MERTEASRDLEFIRSVVDRSSRRVDAHAFHNVHWGLIVLVWFPLANWFEQSGRLSWMIALGVGSVVLGVSIGVVREIRLAKTPRLPGENTFISRQVALMVGASIVAGMTLSAIAPATGFIDGGNVPIIWGLVYTNIAFTMGVVVNRGDFLWSGVLIFAGVVAAMFLQQWNGYILGPAMGLGMIVPGVRAERRLRELIEDEGAQQ